MISLLLTLPCITNDQVITRKGVEASVTHEVPTGTELSITRLPQSEHLGVARFSDTILLYALDDTNEACKKVMEVAGWLLFRTLFGAQNTKVRIGVSYGEFYVNPQKDLFLGKAIVEAHKIEQQQVWMGGALSKGAEERMRRIIPSFPMGWFLAEYPIPVNGGKDADLIGGLAVDWTQGDHDYFDMHWSSNLEEPTAVEWERNHDICTKWRNTRVFHRQRCFWCKRRNNLREDE
jgi:hypothetical protein